jgi:hypothetical protein
VNREPFDPGRDDVLGEALRRALEPAADADDFVAGLLARFDHPLARTSDALASWSRWGVVAAAVVVLAAALLLRSSPDANATLTAALVGSNEAAATTLLTDETAPGSDVLFGSTGDNP